MALLQIWPSDKDTGDGDANTDLIRTSMALSIEGVELQGGPWNVRAKGGYVCLVPVTKTISGAPVMVGKSPTTKVLLKSTDGAGGTVFGSNANQATGLTFRDLEIDGGRAIGGWGAQTGACIGVAGQQDYSATPHNVRVLNCVLRDGFTNQHSFNSVYGVLFDRVFTSATTNPTVASHGGDFDAVALDNPSTKIVMRYCDFDSYGQESLKFENTNNTLVENCKIRQYVTLTQDNAENYADLGSITFRGCYIDAAVGVGLLKRRHVPGAGASVRKAADTLTISAAGVVGGTITATSAPTAFTAGDSGKSIGPYSGFGTGFGIIESVDGSNVATVRVGDVFANNDGTPLVFEANEWVLGWMDNNGDGSVSFIDNTFGPSGLIWAGDGNALNYGTQTITGNYFAVNGNSYKYPAGVTPVASGNVNANMPLKRFVRPAANPKYNGLGGVGVVGLNQATARANCPTEIKTVIGYAVNGDEVVLQDGVYQATPGGENRSINLGGKLITVRAERPYGAVVDLRDPVGGAGWQGLTSSADVAGSLVWGIVFYGAGMYGGNGIGVSITGGSITVRKCAAINCKTANNGPGYKITAGSPVVEDFWIEGCDSGASSQAGALNVVGTGTPIIRRGVIRNNTCTVGAAGVRLSMAGAVVSELEISGNVASGAGVGGATITVGCTINKLTMAGNRGGAVHDLLVGNAITVNGSNWIAWSDDGSAVKSLNVTGGTGTLVLDKSTIFGGAGAVAGTGVKTLTNISSADPKFIDLVGLNLRLKDTSPCLDMGAYAR